MPAGPGATGTTRTISMRLPWRFSTAMPPLAPAREAKTQQPSALGFTANGFEGSAMVTDGEARGALQSPGCAAATAPNAANSVNATRIRMEGIVSPLTGAALSSLEI